MSYALVRSTAVKTHYHAGIRSSSSRPNIKEEKMVWLRKWKTVNVASTYPVFGWDILSSYMHEQGQSEK